MKTLILAALLSLATDGLAQTHPRIFNRPEDQATRARMKADYEANTASPATLGGQMYKRAKTQADIGGRESSNANGLWESWMRLASGDPAYCAKAMLQVQSFLSRAPTCDNAGIAGNFSRNFFISTVITYDWCQQDLSPSQRASYLGKLNLMASCMSAFGGPGNIETTPVASSSVGSPTTITTTAPHGFATGNSVAIVGHAGSAPSVNGSRVITVTSPTSFTVPVNVTASGSGGTVSRRAQDWLGPIDSDATIGDYFGAALFYEITKDYNPAIVAIWNDPLRKIGGFVAPAANDATRRNAIRMYLERFISGGCCLESGEYDWNTMGYLFVGYSALRSLGVPAFPDMEAWLPKAAAAHAMQYAKPFGAKTMGYFWGDLQVKHDGGGLTFYAVSTAMEGAGATKGTPHGPGLQDFVMDWIEARGLDVLGPWPAAWTVFDPYAPRGDHAELPLTVDNPGTGIMMARGGWGNDDWLLGIHSTPCVAVDCSKHGFGLHHHGPIFGEFQLWRRGEFAITHPWTYAGPGLDSRGTNGFSIWGMPAGLIGPFEYRGTPRVARDDAAGYVWQTATQGGSLIINNGYLMPGNYFGRHTRSIAWLPEVAVLLVHDVAQAKDPKIVGVAGYAALVRAYLESVVDPMALWVHSELEPTITGNRVDYPLASGRSVRVTSLLPTSTVLTKHDERIEWQPPYYSLGSVAASEKDWHVKVVPATPAQWDTFLTAWNTPDMAPATVTVVRDIVGHVDAALIDAPGVAAAQLVAFNATPTAFPPERTLQGSFGTWGGAASVLATATTRTAPFSLATTSAKPVHFRAFDLSTTTPWRYRVNGGAAVALSMNAQGAGIASLPAGAFTLLVEPGEGEQGTVPNAPSNAQIQLEVVP